MFHQEFYPTPPEVIQIMLHGVELKNKTILDPSAGSGNLLEYTSRFNDNQKYAYEVEPRLQNILKSDKTVLIGDDFLKSKREDVSHVDLILMNPPFSNADRHIIHAWDVSPEGCEIVALCNWETINNNYSHSRKQLHTTIENYGTAKNLGSVFSYAERKTDADIGLIRLFKPGMKDSFDYDMFFMDEEEEQKKMPGIMTYNEVRSVVNNYVYCLKEFEKIEESLTRINRIGRAADLYTLECTFGNRDKFVSKEEFQVKLQHQSWLRLFNQFGIRKYFTTGVNRKLDDFIRQQKNIPFTMKNIYVMIDMIFQTREQNLNEALVEAVDHYTKFTHRNRYSIPGWKTNSGHMLNKKFIVDHLVDMDWGYPRINWNTAREHMEDLIKVLCNLTGFDFDSALPVHQWVNKNMETNTWYSLMSKKVSDKDGRVIKPGEEIFFEYKFFKKGTMHIKFRDHKTWELLNRKYAEIKGQDLPENI